jgi:hypothetical protein
MCVELYTVKTLLSQSIRSLKIRFLKEDREREREREREDEQRREEEEES